MGNLVPQVELQVTGQLRYGPHGFRVSFKPKSIADLRSTSAADLAQYRQSPQGRHLVGPRQPSGANWISG